MMISRSQHYEEQVSLLLEVLPTIQSFECFALKGGTAINLFIRDMPRLSVDIDLTYLPLHPRNIFLKNFNDTMEIIAKQLESRELSVARKYTKEQGHLIKLIVSNNIANIKVEPNMILRGSVYNIEKRELTQRAQETYLQSQTVRLLSLADIYAGKICAALDRQHPRDLFDIKLLYEHEGISDAIRKAFVIYLASGSRPMHELLSPNQLDFQDIFEKEFVGMTTEPVAYNELLCARDQLIKDINQQLTGTERQFLLSIKQCEPDYDLMPFAHLSQLPALQWKILNLQRMDKHKRTAQLEKLKKILGV